MKRLVWLAGFVACLAAPGRSVGQYTTTGGAVTELFQSFTAAGFSSGATAASGRLDSNAFAVSGWSDGDLDFGGTRTTVSTDYTRGASTGGITTGGVYAFNVGGGDIGLGVQPGSSDFAPGAIYVKIKNTGADFTGFNASYVRGVRNDQGRSNSFNFSYAVTSVDATLTQAASLTYTTADSFTSTATADASPAFVTANVSADDTTTLVATNSFIFLRWTSSDFGGSGSRDEFAIASFSVTPVPEPAAVLAVAAAGLGLLRLRRPA